jgi:hypothetical protein
MSSVTKIEGVIRRGGDVPVINPHKPVIIGFDESNSESVWFSFCPRADEPVDEAFIASIREPNEVRDPIHVCRDGDRVLVLDGRRRVKAARIVWDEQNAAGVPEDRRVILRFVMQTGTPAEFFRVNRSSHDDRKELTPFQRAQLMAHYAKHVDGMQAVAEEFGCTVQTAKNNLAILNCSERVQAKYNDGTITATAAVRLSRLPRAEQDAKLDRMIAGGATRGARAERVIQEGDDGEGGVATRLRPIGFFERLRLDLNPTANEIDRVAHAVIGFSLGDEHALDPWPELQARAHAALKRRRRGPNGMYVAGEASEELGDPRQLALVS